MRIRLQNRDLQEMLLETSYPESFSTLKEGGVCERTYSAKLLGGEGTYREIFMENIHIGYGNLMARELTELTFEAEMETVELHFGLQGETFAQELGSQEIYEFGYNQHNIIYASDFKGRSMVRPNQRIKIFEINLMPQFFKRFLPQSSDTFLQFLASLERQESGFLSPHNYPITPSMHAVIQEILCCDRKGVFKRMYLEAKVIELLLLQLEQMISLKSPKTLLLRQLEIDRLHAVREYLLHNLDRPCTLMQLARQFGTNEYALKVGFKQIFGTTVFEYWNSAKMQQAKRWLLDEDLTVSQVADRIGYKNPQHFSTAFKKRFGYPPSTLK
ncbi:MAG: AraC family transcriptional regulator [Bacteroidota bacterium]